MSNSNNLVHIASVTDGAIVSFPHSAYAYMKVCDSNGIGGVVRLSTGSYIPTRELEAEGLGLKCHVDFPTIDRMYAETIDTEEDEDEIDDYAIAMRESLGKNWW